MIDDDITDDDIEEFYDRVIEEFNKKIIEARKLPAGTSNVVNLYAHQIHKRGLVSFEVALEMIDCGYDPMDETDVDEFYGEIVEQYIIDIANKKKKNAKKVKKNIIKFPSPRKKPLTP